MNAASKWLADNLAAVIVAVAQANAVLAPQPQQPLASQEGSQDE
ncbi:hypothetical protein PJJ30_28770 [Mycobacterium kansasii]|nr:MULTISPECIES: hypothetical protein [Mycobacterium]